jgi:hypothetical protein
LQQGSYGGPAKEYDSPRLGGACADASDQDRFGHKKIYTISIHCNLSIFFKNLKDFRIYSHPLPGTSSAVLTINRCNSPSDTTLDDLVVLERKERAPASSFKRNTGT